MRRIIFIIMIALLPLRGWIGEAMATEMAAINLIAAQATNTKSIDYLHIENSMSDCDMHKTKAVDGQTAKPLCTHCQACHATGLVCTAQIASFDKVQCAQPLAQASQFVSANLALTQKPPIL